MTGDHYKGKRTRQGINTWGRTLPKDVGKEPHPAKEIYAQKDTIKNGL